MTRIEATARLLAHWCCIQDDEEHLDAFPLGFTEDNWRTLFVESEREIWRQRARELLTIITLLGDD